MINIGFIGAGNMGTAIMKGIASSSLGEKVKLFAFDPCAEKIQALKEYGLLAGTGLLLLKTPAGR